MRDLSYSNLAKFRPKAFAVVAILAISPAFLSLTQSGKSTVVTPRFGMIAPVLTCKSLDGKKIPANFFKNKVVLLDYWATWCKPCIDMMPEIDRIKRKYEGKGFSVISISIDEDSKALRKFLSGLTSIEPVYHDNSKGFKKWGVTVVPTVFLLKNGVVKGIFYFSDVAKIEGAVRAELGKA